MDKRLHPGWASHAGIVAARLAAAGFTGPDDILEGRYGFLSAYSSKSDPALLWRNSAEHFAIMDVSLKPYACCRYMHGPIDCLLSIRHAHALDPAHITRIACGVLSGGRGLVADPIAQKQQPQNGVDAQFSMPFGAAIALLTGQAGLAVFTAEWLQHADIQSLMRKVECYCSTDLDDSYPEEWRASASVKMDDGREFLADIRYPLGDPHNPLTWEQLESRFHELVTPVIKDVEERQKIIEKVKGLDKVEKIGWDN